MKYIYKLTQTLLLIVLLSNCERVYEFIDDVSLNYLKGQELYDNDFPEMKTYQDVAVYVQSVLDWEDMVLNPIVSPQEAIEKGIGNCTTYAILFMNVAHFTLGVDFDFASVDASEYTQRTVIEGGIPDHSVVNLDGQLYSAYTGKPITEYGAGYIYTFDEIFTTP